MAEPCFNAHGRVAVITDWRVRDEDLPDVSPGAEYECVIVPQKFVAIHRIVVRDLALVRLKIGPVEAVPFKLESAKGPLRTYRLGDLGDADLRRSLLKIGAAVATSTSIAIAPGLEIRTVLRNEEDAPAKPRVALMVHEEVA